MKKKILNNKSRIYKISSQELSLNTINYLRKINTGGLYNVYLNRIRKHHKVHTEKTRILTACNLTGRTKGPITSYNLSRISFRELTQKGFLTGIHKYSW